MDDELGFPVSKRQPDKDDIKTSEIPGGKVASCLYTGPYNEITPAYFALSQWVVANGYESTGVAYEIYLDDPNHTPPKELKTIIQVPLKTKGRNEAAHSEEAAARK